MQRSFTITKLKNNIKTIGSFISGEENNLTILTSIGRLFKFSLSNKIIADDKTIQGLMIAKLFPNEQIVSCCSYQMEKIFIWSLCKEKSFV